MATTSSILTIDSSGNASPLTHRAWHAKRVSDRYGSDVLANDPHRRPTIVIPEVGAEHGLVVECAESGFCGSVVRVEKAIEGRTVELEDRHGKRRVFVMRPGAFLIDGQPISLKPVAIGPTKRTTTASGSILAPTTRAQVAKSSRIWVEGVHDAELVEKVWGEDLRGETIVVEPLHGRTTWSVHCATSARTHSAKLVCCSITWLAAQKSHGSPLTQFERSHPMSM